MKTPQCYPVLQDRCPLPPHVQVAPKDPKPSSASTLKEARPFQLSPVPQSAIATDHLCAALAGNVQALTDLDAGGESTIPRKSSSH